MSPEELSLSEDEVGGLIPHRRPFRFIDGATILEPGRKAQAALADLTAPEFDYLKAHFPGGQIIPGAILVEAMAELLGTAAASGGQSYEGRVGVFRRINNLVFRRAVLPTDPVTLEAEVTTMKLGLVVGNVRALLGEEVAAEGELTFGLVDRNQLMTSLQNRGNNPTQT